MEIVVPGTNLPLQQSFKACAFSQISPILTATGGLTLSQLASLTGLEGSTIQNWIKRGWVVNIGGKKYFEVQIVRILLINMVRMTMQLDQITALMSYINGEVEDRSDDIIPDIELFNLLCDLIYDMNAKKIYETEPLKELISQKVNNCVSYRPSGRTQLENTLLIMSLAYQSAQIKKQVTMQYQLLNL